MSCVDCSKNLTFISKKKKDFNYCKKCWTKQCKNGKIPCSCGNGFRRVCGCGKLLHCRFCKPDWINEYCEWCL